MNEWLGRPLTTLKGIGPEVARKLDRLGLVTIADLIYHFPRRYDDFSQIVPIRAMRPGPVSFRGTIERVGSRYSRNRKLHITEAIISDGTGTVKAIWFNQRFLAKTLPVGKLVMMSGKLEFRNSDLALQSPAVEPVEEGTNTTHTARIVPVYPETEGLSSRQLRTLVQPLLTMMDNVPETMPDTVVKDSSLMRLGQALMEIHFPTSTTNLEKARFRLAFEELWFLMLASLSIKQEIKGESAVGIDFKVDTARAFTGKLGFELTDAQRQAAWQILQDMRGTSPMNRLLEGDVGSGKTVVGAMAAVMAMANGYQAALMVPTEILARQHYAKLSPLLDSLGFPATLLVAGLAAADKKAAQAAACVDAPRLIIGTQALLSESVQFANLGLVIIDEQHRFGVGQRQLLKVKAGRLPHLLSMTATPIPRSLQLTVYGDLDITVIDSLPPGRKPIKTVLIGERQRDEMYKDLREQLTAGRQAFVICPLIEESELMTSRNVTAEAERLASGPLKDFRIGVLHGRMKADDKRVAMEQFVAGQFDVLVATTVIEVGVDVPNATVMIIEGAQSFGLAALHQLRGRIGRGSEASFCYLLPDTDGETTLQRLKALEKTQDGFRLAQIDLELRGPGQIYGRMQHGALNLQFADITDAKLLSAARTSAATFVQDASAMIKYPEVAERVNRLKAVTSLD